MKSFPARNPVFVDSTGRRHRSIRRFGALLAVPVVGYVVLLGSSLLGGPRVETPLIPLPEAAKQQTGPGPRVPPAQSEATESPRPQETSGSEPTADPSTTGDPVEPTDQPTTAASRPGVIPSNAGSPTPTPTATATLPKPPTSTPTPTPTLTPTPTVDPPGHGKPTPPGQTKTPSKP